MILVASQVRLNLNFQIYQLFFVFALILSSSRKTQLQKSLISLGPTLVYNCVITVSIHQYKICVLNNNFLQKDIDLDIPCRKTVFFFYSFT